MKFRIVLLLIFIGTNLQAQDSLQRHIISLNTISYLGSQVPRWTAGYTTKIADRWWAGTEIGYGTFWLSVHGRENDFLTRDYKLIEVRPQIYYDLRARGKLKHLLSAELFYINHTDRLRSDWYYGETAAVYYEYDAARYKRVKTGVNINLNTIYYLGKKFVLWQQIGAGIRNRKVSFSDLDNLRRSERFNDGEEHFGWVGEYNYVREEGSSLRFNFNLELKLAYIF